MKKYWWSSKNYYVLQCVNVTSKNNKVNQILVFWKYGLVSLTTGKSMKAKAKFPRIIPDPCMFILGNC